MKKTLFIISAFIISFCIFINTGNRNLICNELLYKKLWINKTLKIEMCIPYNYLGFGAYGHIYNKKKNILSAHYFDNSLYKIGLLQSNNSDLFFGGCFGKKSKKYLLGKLEVFDCIDEGTKKYKYTEFNFKDDIFFSFDKNNKEHVTIINSIKPLTEK